MKRELFAAWLLPYDNSMEEFMATRNTPRCKCYGYWHPLGSANCDYAVSEAQLKQDERELAQTLREGMQVEATDADILKFVGSQAAIVQRRMQMRFWLCLAGCCVAIALVFALLVWGKA